MIEMKHSKECFGYKFSKKSLLIFYFQKKFIKVRIFFLKKSLKYIKMEIFVVNCKKSTTYEWKKKKEKQIIGISSSNSNDFTKINTSKKKTKPSDH